MPPEDQRVRADRTALLQRALIPAVVVLGVVCLVIILVVARGDHMIDLEVYRAGASALLQGHDPYEAHPARASLVFTYPPFAILPAVVLTLLPAHLSQVMLTALSEAAAVVICVRALSLSLPWLPRRRLWALALAVSAPLLLLEPVFRTLRLGQVNLIIVAAVVYDVGTKTGRRPHGALVGLVTAVKLTPAIFIAYLALTRRLRDAAIAVGVAVAATGVGFVFAPRASLDYWGTYVTHPRRVGTIHYISNQSLSGVIARLSGHVDGGRVLWAAIAALVAVAGLWLAARISLRGDELLGIVVCALTGLLVSPISWSHHWVWVLPLASALWGAWFVCPSRARLAAALVWTVPFWLRLVWMAPHDNNVELRQGAIDMAIGNAYVIIAGLTLVVVALCMHRSSPADRLLLVGDPRGV